jgi:hypothetical protein
VVNLSPTSTVQIRDEQWVLVMSNGRSYVLSDDDVANLMDETLLDFRFAEK